MKILSICGSPRRGNSETILLELQKLFQKKGVDNEIVLLHQKNIERCHGCVENCNPAGVCCLKDDMNEIIDKMVSADALIFISPNYFQMPTGLFKDFMDRSCVVFAANKDKILLTKKTVVIAVGREAEENITCMNNIANFYCRWISNVVIKKSFQTNSELKGNYNDIFENGLNPDIQKDLLSIVTAITK